MDKLKQLGKDIKEKMSPDHPENKSKITEKTVITNDKGEVTESACSRETIEKKGGKTKTTSISKETTGTNDCCMNTGRDDGKDNRSSTTTGTSAPTVKGDWSVNRDGGGDRRTSSTTGTGTGTHGCSMNTNVGRDNRDPDRDNRTSSATGTETHGCSMNTNIGRDNRDSDRDNRSSQMTGTTKSGWSVNRGTGGDKRPILMTGTETSTVNGDWSVNRDSGEDNRTVNRVTDGDDRSSSATITTQI
jgi:hypothetical protein